MGSCLHKSSKAYYVADRHNRNERVVVFPDIRPAAARHLLVIPRQHIANTDSLEPSDLELVQEMHRVGAQILAKESPGEVHKFGYHVPPWRSVDHLHLHAFALPHNPPWKVLKYCFPCVWLISEGLEQRLKQQAEQPQGLASADPDAAALQEPFSPGDPSLPPV